MKMTRCRGVCPSPAFLLILLGSVLFLLIREMGTDGYGGDSPEPRDWVCLADVEYGSACHTFERGCLLGQLANEVLPPLSNRLSSRCKGIVLQPGTEIRLARGEGGEERRCAVFPLPEGCRYLLGMPLDVNRAGAEELALLPGIGPRLAARIIEVRDSVGCFSSPEDLLHVPGIGKRLLQRIQGRIAFGPGA